MKYIVSLDQGTTSSRAVIFDESANVVASHNVEFPQIYPKPGWVEHKPQDILDSQLRALKLAVEKSGIDVRSIAAIGIANQRETTLLWEKSSGMPLGNAIVWQCRRTAPLVERLKSDGYHSQRPHPCGEGRIVLRHGGFLPCMASHRRQGACDRRHQRRPHHALQHPRAEVG